MPARAAKTAKKPRTARPPSVEIVCIGSELLQGKPNTHVDYQALLLKGSGLAVTRAVTVGDSLKDLTEALATALKRADVVICSGGLGPTFDDLTREAAAAATGLTMRTDKRLADGIRWKFRRVRIRMPDENLRQASVIKGAVVLENHHGSAPGQIIEDKGRVLVLLPGPATEMKPMFEQAVLPWLGERFGRGLARETLSWHFCGITESALDTALVPVMKQAPEGLEFTILGGPALSHFYATASAQTREEARRDLERFQALLPDFVKDKLYSVGDEDLETVVGNALRARKATLSVAESCTGGLLGAKLTDVPGSSDYFVGGVIAYANQVKQSELGVPEALLAEHGAVSEAVARAMAEGARRHFGTDYALAVTGIAGPGGGTEAKPVGLVYIALASEGKTEILERRCFGDRRRVRMQSSNLAMDLLRRALL